MSKEIDKLLAVLDMPEEEQIEFLKDELPDLRGDIINGGISLADLAFRLRDEAMPYCCGGGWLDIIRRITVYMEKYVVCDKCQQSKATKSWNWDIQAQPIHWIIASLIAKALQGKE